MKKICVCSWILAVLLVFFSISEVLAQSITMTAPTSNVSLAEGDDFATAQLQNPWDFNERRDMGWEENFVDPGVTVSGGIWSGTYKTAGGYVFPLFPGFNRAVQNELLPGDKNLPSLGINKPIEASKYSRLCYRAKTSSPSSYAIYWANDPSKAEYWPGGENFGSSYDGFYPATGLAGMFRTGWQISCFDMSSISTAFEQKGGSWSGNIHALRIDLSALGPAGTTAEFDWVRLVDPNSAPNVTISWSSSGLTSNEVRTLYVDTDNSGFDGTPLTRFLIGSDPGTYTLNSAILPPGEYYFYLTSQAVSGGSFSGPVTTSGYTAKVSISSAPNAIITSPSQTSGMEYAKDELGNAWDMDSSTDIINLDRSKYIDVFRQFSNESFASSSDAEDAGKVFQAQADPALPGNTEGDNQLHLNISASNPIQAGKYRYLVYRIAADATEFPTIADKVRDGWVTRPIWWNNDVIADGGDPGAHVLYEGWHTYAMDMWTLPLFRGSAWTSYSQIKNLRIDPLETNKSTWFYLDYVRLYAENRALNNEFTISYTLSDADSTLFNVGLYYDNNKTGFDGTLIANLTGVPAGANTYTWNTSGLTDGASYYVYLVVSDGVNTSKFYSPVHVVMGTYKPTPVSRLGSAEFDYDGDAKSDLILYTPTASSGAVISSLSTASSHSLAKKKKPKKPKKPKKSKKSKNSTPPTSYVYSKTYQSKTGTSTLNAHTAGSRIIGADLNGDYWADLLVVREDTATGLMTFTGVESRTATAINKTLGVVGDIPLKGDFNGNNKDELVAYRNGAWYIMNEAGQVSLTNWGMVGDKPTPADFDGDGQTDFAIYRPSTGTWWILYSGYAGGYASNYYAEIQFGLDGDIPVPADYDGDGRDDAAVFRPSDSTWYVRYSKDGTSTTLAWGNSALGDVPFARLDTNGDLKAEFVVYRPGTGSWYINYGNGETKTIAHGGASDLLPVNR